MPGWLRSAGSGPLTSMLSNATSTAWINQHQRKGRQGEEDDRSRAVHTGSGQRGAGTKGRREVDAHSRQRTAPPAGKSLAGADRPGASARVGAVRRRSEPGYGWTTVKLTTVGAPDAARLRNNSDASRRSQGCSSTTGAATTSGGNSKPLGGGTRLTLWHNIDRRFISMGAAGLAHLLRCAGSASRRMSPSDASSAPRP